MTVIVVVAKEQAFAFGSKPDVLPLLIEKVLVQGTHFALAASKTY